MRDSMIQMLWQVRKLSWVYSTVQYNIILLRKLSGRNLNTVEYVWEVNRRCGFLISTKYLQMSSTGERNKGPVETACWVPWEYRGTSHDVDIGHRSCEALFGEALVYSWSSIDDSWRKMRTWKFRKVELMGVKNAEQEVAGKMAHFIHETIFIQHCVHTENATTSKL